MLRRKIGTAIFSSLLFSLIFSTIGGFEGDVFYNLYYTNLLFVITYGVIASLLSDWISRQLSTKGYAREIISFFFHCFFGIVFLVFSLVSAISFFIVDRLLAKVKFGWLACIIALVSVVLVFIILINR